MSIYVQLELRLVNSLVLPRLLFIILEISDYKADQRAKRTMHEKTVEEVSLSRTFLVYRRNLELD